MTEPVSKMSANGLLAELFSAANDAESHTIEEVAIRAGVLWRCTVCKATGDNDEVQCYNGHVR